MKQVAVLLSVLLFRATDWQVRFRPYELRHQRKETDKWASLFVVVFAVVTNCVFYFTFQLSRTDDASVALQRLKSSSRYTLAADGGSSGSASPNDSTLSPSSNPVAGGLSWVVFFMCCGLFVVLVGSFMRSLLLTYPWVARDVGTRTLKQLELATLRGKHVAQLAVVNNPLLHSGAGVGSRPGGMSRSSGSGDPNRTAADGKAVPKGRGDVPARPVGRGSDRRSGAPLSDSDALKALGQYRPGLAPSPRDRHVASDAQGRTGRQLRVERIGAAPDRTRSAAAAGAAATGPGRR